MNFAVRSGRVYCHKKMRIAMELLFRSVAYAASGKMGSWMQVHQRLDKLDADVAGFKEASADKSSQLVAAQAPAAPT